MAVITISYKHGVRMDIDSYLTKHAPIVVKAWGAPGMERAVNQEADRRR